MIQLPKVKQEYASKARQVEDFVRRMIETGEFKPGVQLPSEVEIAKQTGVYRLTVNKAMSNLVASGHLYRLHGKGTFVADRTQAKAENISSAKLKQAFMLFIGKTADASNVYLTSPYHALCNYLGAADIMLKSFQADDFPSCERHLAQKPDICVAFTFGAVNKDDVAVFAKSNVPVILFNNRVPGMPSVNTNNEESTRLLTEAIIARGHKCIPFLHFSNATSTMRERLAGYSKAMERNSLLPMPIPLSGWLADSSLEALNRLAAAKLDFSAVICEGAGLLQGARQWLDAQRQANARKELTLACLDNWGGALGLEIPADFSVETPLKEMGVKTGELLMRMLEGPASESVDIVVPANLKLPEDKETR